MKLASSVGKRSASRATITLRAVRASSRAPSSRSTKPRRSEMMPASRNRVRKASETPRAHASNWHTARRPSGCQHQWPLDGSPLPNSRSASMSKSVTVGCPRRYTSSLYFGSLSLANVLNAFARDLGTIMSRPSSAAGFGRLRNFQMLSDFSIRTSGHANMAFNIFSSSTLRAATTAMSVPSTPLGGIGGKFTPGHSCSKPLCNVSKSP
mmetsp:Transcript_70068/g.194752  ORF Transcript_70068/g.194752 Transcript_70068/m.194752 type:complete len:209 (+) Transcript_70068:2270-2896(+)